MVKIVLFVILGIAACFRFYQISSVPPSASLDEVSLGWNAYALMKTGKDEYGALFPVLLRAYDDYRPALYSYLIIPFLPLFGLSAMAVRMPSILLSVATVLFTFFLARTLTKNVFIGIIAAFLLSISPWHIYISRLGHEANAGLAFGVIAIAVFFLFLSSTAKRWLIIVSALCFVGALYSYQSQKIIIPLIILTLGIFFRKELLRQNRIVLLSIVISFFLLIPLINATFSSNGLVRFHGTSVLNDSHPLYEKARQEFVAAKKEHNLLQQIINHPRFTSLRIVGEQYFLHFSLQWLFAGTADEAHKVPFTGLLYLWEFPFIILGFFVAYKTLERRCFLFLIIWLLSSPLPASITTQAPHAMRSYTFLPVWQMFGAMGIFYFFRRGNLSFRIAGMLIFSVVIMISIKDFVNNYFFVFPKTHSHAFSYATSETMQYLSNNKDKYKKVVISHKLGQRYQYPSYMFFLFHTQYDPQTYLSFGGTKSGSFEAEHIIDRYEFRAIGDDERDQKTLYIENYSEQKDGKQVQYIGRYLDGIPGVMAYLYD
jgi:4-amino-4-deoxy-L-arabinose transferase-like glycosyltransferase